MVNPIDDQGDNLALTQLAKMHLPNLKLMVHARDMGHRSALPQMGMDAGECETFESALAWGGRALEQLGIGRCEARERADSFRRLNRQMREGVAVQPVEDTEFKYDAYKQAYALLTKMFNEDLTPPSPVGLGQIRGVEKNASPISLSRDEKVR
ncbi:hypothetical protein BK634_21310 [Pseudomonas chlororaphis]|jgi:glutathione-regulated potassium-efflux system ancillary protein KefC|nr:hypothetical protein BK634_21310 [Pseudomonas chlororaphis]